MKTGKNFLLQKLSFLVITFMMLTMIACEKESDINNSGNEKTRQAISTEGFGSNDDKSVNDEPLIMCSKVFAQAQNNTIFRDLIASEIGKTESNVVFYVQIKNKLIGNMTVADLFQSIANRMGMTLSEDYFSNELSKIIPNLSFAAYSNNSGTNMKGFSYNKSFYVLPATTNFDTEAKKVGVGYDQNLNEVQLSNTEDPNVSVIVVEDNRDYAFVSENYGQSDIQNLLNKYGIDVCDKSMKKVQSATMPLNNLKKADVLYGKKLINLNELISLNMANCDDLVDNIDYNELENFDFDKGNDFDYKGVPFTVTQGSYCTSSCDRNNRSGRERLTKIQVRHSELKKFCKWWKSNCKIEVDYSFATLQSAEPVLSDYPSKFVIGDRSDMKNDQVFRTDLDLAKWMHCEGTHGGPYAINFIGKHHNAGSTSTFSIGLPEISFIISGVTVKFSKILNFSTTSTTTDTPLGGDVIYYCDGASGDGTEYTTGSMDFFIKKNTN